MCGIWELRSVLGLNQSRLNRQAQSAPQTTAMACQLDVHSDRWLRPNSTDCKQVLENYGTVWHDKSELD